MTCSPLRRFLVSLDGKEFIVYAENPEDARQSLRSSLGERYRTFHAGIVELRQILSEIRSGEEVSASPELWALAEEVCAGKNETDENKWAQRLASDIVEADQYKKDTIQIKTWKKY